MFSPWMGRLDRFELELLYRKTTTWWCRTERARESISSWLLERRAKPWWLLSVDKVLPCNVFLQGGPGGGGWTPFKRERGRNVSYILKTIHRNKTVSSRSASWYGGGGEFGLWEGTIHDENVLNWSNAACQNVLTIMSGWALFLFVCQCIFVFLCTVSVHVTQSLFLLLLFLLTHPVLSI